LFVSFPYGPDFDSAKKETRLYYWANLHGFCEKKRLLHPAKPRNSFSNKE